MNISFAARFFASSLLCLCFSAEAFKLSPEGSFIERKLASRTQGYWEKTLANYTLKGIHVIGGSVHEEITNRILGCEGDGDVCGDPEFDPMNAYVLAGVRWNDDPPFRFEKGHGNFGGCEPGATVRLVTFPRCWGSVFKDGEKNASRGKTLDAKTAPLLVRSHFGDMQFLHSMAARDNEPASDVRARIMAWAEFTWKIALNEVPLSTRVRDIPVSGFVELFGPKGWSVQDLFSLGNPHIRKPENMSAVAFGSLLHMVQDSFASGHVERASPDGREKCPSPNEHLMPGRIVEFHSYGQQDAAKHGHADAREAFSAHWSSARPNIIDVGKVLHGYFLRRAEWVEVRPYLECLFVLDTEVRPASAGEAYSH